MNEGRTFTNAVNTIATTFVTFSADCFSLSNNKLSVLLLFHFSFDFCLLKFCFSLFEPFVWFLWVVYRLSASLRFIVLADLLCFILFFVALCTNSYLLLSLLKYIYIDIYIYIFVFAYFRFSPICLALFNFYLPKISWSLLSASAFLGIYM